MSYGYMTKEVARLRAEIDELLKQAQDVDAVDEAVLGARRGDELPEELGRRQDRLATIEAAMKRLEAEARAVADAERQRREEAEAQRQRAGTKRRGRRPVRSWRPPRTRRRPTSPNPSCRSCGPITRVDCCGNAQASVDGECQIILACDVTDQCNDNNRPSRWLRPLVANWTSRDCPDRG